MTNHRTAARILTIGLSAILLVAVVVVGSHYRDTVSMASATPTVSAPVSAPVACPTVAVNFARSSYDGQTWTAENGDGAIVGYALAEDSLVYATADCATNSPRY